MGDKTEESVQSHRHDSGQFFPAHRTENVAITSEILDIELIFLPPYSPQLNPIELIWKSIKRIIQGPL
jgi:transposase